VRRWLTLLLVVALGAAVLPACLVVPGDTSQIALVSSTTANGWRFDYYRNSAYRCAVSGFQTFTVGTRVGSSATASAPLWVWLHGDGVGWSNNAGSPQPDFNQMFEESAASHHLHCARWRWRELLHRVPRLGSRAGDPDVFEQG